MSVGGLEKKDSVIPGAARGSKVNSGIADPCFLLAPPRSFTSVLCATLGQHPQMYGLPELQLFGAETMDEWSGLCARASFPMAHGLLRVIAQLFFGEQTERTIKQARGWLRRRSHFTTGLMLEMLAEKIHPLILVEKSPSAVYHAEFLQRIYSMFPGARFIHFVRHPRGHGKSVLKAIEEASAHGMVPQWLVTLASYPYPFDSERGKPPVNSGFDPQRGWYALHMNICEFLKSVPLDQKIRLKGEDVLTAPDRFLKEIADWIGLRTDAEAIEEMKHPERSPYACFGPIGARYGNDAFFLDSPALRPDRAKPHSLEGPLGWREDGQGFFPEVKVLARQFGYE